MFIDNVFNMLLEILIPLNIATPIICIFIFCYNESGFKLDHVFIISSGFIYFWMLPLTFYHYNIFSIMINEIPFAENLGLEYIKIDNERYGYYLIITFCIYISFIFGEYLSSRIKYKYTKISPFSKTPLSYILLIFTVILVILTLATSSHYFKGYDRTFFSLQGNIIALNLMLLMLLYFEYLHSPRSVNFANIFNSTYFIIYLISTILLASLGNRTWLICGLLSFIICYSNYYKRISILNIIVGFVLLLLIMGMFPMFRNGAEFLTKLNEVSPSRLLYLALYDTFATHNSLKYFLAQDNLQYFNIPIVLFSKIFNIIPSFIIPDKHILYYTFEHMGTGVLRVQGGSHNFVFLMSHFGVVGTILLSFIMPFIINYFKQSIHYISIYIFITAHLAAPFFRDFDNFVIKILLQFAILMPMLYLLLCGIYKTKYKQ